MADVPAHLKKWRPPQGKPHYERSFDNGTSWSICCQRDLFNAFGVIKAIARRLDAGETIRSQYGVLYRRRAVVK